MPFLFAFPASKTLTREFNEVLAAFADGVPSTPQAGAVVSLAQRYADEIVDALVLNLMKGSSASSSAPKVLDTVAKVIKSTAHTLVKQVLAKMSNAELRPMTSYIASRRTQHPVAGVLRDFISFELEQADFLLLKQAWADAAAHGDNHAAMTDAMLRFADLAVQAFYRESAQAVTLGFIARNVFAVGDTAISKGSKSAIKRLIPALKRTELQAFGRYFGDMLLESA
ncbi:hypothetical protein DFR26_1958 [Paraperlucidibaca baekdonensis]|uniref:Uncharacterized protein n=1 Tax=Paraperlucidibaca baekdonensis TaxID=748120 RepID=A0A3E0H1P7_9GAMM|nr:hypothetical protein [Paraperlucidibaca baekdonensis]REH36820.1 hypothetical protein DFR26_1958 [Paraperlucidibaca baekdonensis]